MADDKQDDDKRGVGRPSKIDVSQELCEKQELETILGQIPSGYTIQVHREEPEWCRGYLGKIYCDNENLNLDSIKTRFGGRILSLRFVNSQAKFKGSKRVIFPDPPKKDGRVITEEDIDFVPRRDRDGSDRIQHGMIPPGLPPHLAAQIAAFYAGYPIPQSPPPQPAQNPLDIMQATQIMNLMNSQMSAQQELMKANMAHMREMESIRQQAEEERERRRRMYEKDKGSLGEVQGAISLLRELNGIKSEFGGATNPTTEIIQHAAPILENAIGELIDLYKLKAQAEISSHAAPREAPPPLPSRQVSSTVVSLPKPQSGNGKTDPVSMAKELRRYYDGLSVNEQQEVMKAFLSTNEPHESVDESGDTELIEQEQILDPVNPTIQNQTGSSILSEEDRELLENEDTDEQDQGPQVQVREHSPSTEADDQDNRKGD
jgi:hypothetical protein